MSQFKNLKMKLLYAFDNSISRGAGSIILWSTLVLLIVIFLMAVLVWFSGVSPEKSFSDQAGAFLGTVLTYLKYQPTSSSSYVHVFATFILFITNILLSGALIGAITNGLSDKLAKLRTGHSNIIESGHTVILGWSPQVFNIVSELLIANENQRKSVIVILGLPSRAEMTSQIDKHFGKIKRTKVLCRQGDRRNRNDLDQLSLHTSKSIIINPHTRYAGDILKCLLAVINTNNRTEKPFHIVTAVDGVELYKTCKLIGKNEVEVVHASDFCARLEAQTCRQSGLPYVYTELLNFSGDEIYSQQEPRLNGKSYGDILPLYRDSTIIGICSESDEIFLNPDRGMVFNEGFKVIAIAEDDDTIQLASDSGLEIDVGAIVTKNRAEARPEHYLILGWSINTTGMLENLDDYVAPGSSAEILYLEGSEINLDTNELRNLQVMARSIDFHLRKNLDEIEFSKFKAVIIQAETDIGIEDSDTLAMSLLINLRDIRSKVDFNFSILTKLLDAHNQDIVNSDEADDFIISDIIVSSAVAQIAENKMLADVFAELFKSHGSEIYLKPANDYIVENSPVNFFTVVESALRKEETAIGYRLSQYASVKSRFVGKKEMTYGVILNPEKNKKIILSPEDSIIVLSEN